MMMERKRKLHHTTSSTSNNNNNNNHDDVDYISSVTPRQDMMPTRNDALPHHSFSSSTHRLGRRMGLLVTTQVLLILLSTQHVMVHYSGETEQHFHYWQDDSDSDMVDTHNHHDNIDNDNACRRFFRPVENATWLFAKPPIHSNAATTNNNSLVVPPPVIRQSLPTRCGRLRRPWWNMIRQRSAKQQSSSFKSSSFKSSSFKSSSVSSLFEEIAAFQSNCSAPVMRFELDNSFGLGSHLVLWSQALCNAWEKGHRLVTTMNAENEQWLWRDEAQCGSKNNKNENDGSSFHHHHHHESPWECYFARVELPAAAAAACPLPTGAYQQDNTAQHTSNRTTTTTTTFSPSVPDPRDPKRFCAPLRRTNNSNNKNTTSSSSSSSSLFLRHYRAQAFAHLFRHITPTVLREAERQVGLLFASNDSHARNHGGVVVPHDCIAVHIRWVSIHAWAGGFILCQLLLLTLYGVRLFSVVTIIYLFIIYCSFARATNSGKWTSWIFQNTLRPFSKFSIIDENDNNKSRYTFTCPPKIPRPRMPLSPPSVPMKPHAIGALPSMSP